MPASTLAHLQTKDNPFDRIQTLKATKPRIAEFTWACGLTILDYETPVPRANTFDSPEAELAHLIETQPPCNADPLGQTIDTREQTIAQEAARHGIRLLDLTVAEDNNGNDPWLPTDETEVPTEVGYPGMTPYTTLDRLTQYRIDWERRTFHSGPIQRIRVVQRETGPDIQISGYGRLNAAQRAQVAEAYVKWHVATLGRTPDPMAFTNLKALCDHLRERGEIPNLITLTKRLPDRSYFETDEDPNRHALATADLEQHMGYGFLEELDDEEVAAQDAGMFIERIQLYNLRGHRIPGWESMDPQERADAAETYIAQTRLNYADYAGSNTTLSGLDHELAATEWDLGQDLLDDIGDILASEAETIASDPWVQTS